MLSHILTYSSPVVFLICTSYTRWSSSQFVAGSDGATDTLPAAHHLDALLLYAMELKFYLMFLLSAFDLFGELRSTLAAFDVMCVLIRSVPLTVYLPISLSPSLRPRLRVYRPSVFPSSGSDVSSFRSRPHPLLLRAPRSCPFAHLGRGRVSGRLRGPRQSSFTHILRHRG